MRTLFLMVFIGSALPIAGQTGYPKGYFRNPLNIGMSLSGNFGELRPNHYHMGIDIKTAQRINLPVHAAADGYIARVKVEPGGFGQAIYINHPNGYTTVYAHLNRFSSRLDEYIRQQQYLQESWALQLEVPVGMFPVKKGDLIAYSGNTGGSQAPHLHFEIRRTEDDTNLNPLLFGFPVADNVRPRILRLALYDRSRSIYEQSPKVFALKPLSSTTFTTSVPLLKVNAPLVSLAITAFDTHTGSTNLNGVYQARLFVNDAEEESFLMDTISYFDTRYLNAHIDYRYRTLSRIYLQHLTELPGHLNSVYRRGGGRGVIDISNGETFDIRIEVKDTEGNTTNLKTRIQYDFSKSPAAEPGGKMFYPLMLDGFESENCEFFIGEQGLYDSVHIKYLNTASGDGDVVSDVHTIGSGYIPLHEAMLVRIRPDLTYRPADSAQIVMQWNSGASTAVRKVTWQNGWAHARFRDFGNFRLVRDTIPPQVVPSGFADGSDLSKASRIVFSVKDNLPGVKRVRAELDGKWLRFTNDKGRSFIYYFDEKCPPGNHILAISAEDEAGNRVEKKFRIRR